MNLFIWKKIMNDITQWDKVLTTTEILQLRGELPIYMEDIYLLFPDGSSKISS